MKPLLVTDPPAVGEFTLLGRLGAGGMGQVYLGATRSGRPVAVKVVKPDIAADPAFRARFVREVAAARQVGGFWTASVVAADPAAAAPWLATEYVPGPSLQQAVREVGPLPVLAVRVVGARLAEALAAIHAAGLVHRDLKPANVLLAPDGPKVIDFGITRAFETDTANLTSVIGTPSFMAPEQIQGEPLSPASDVFSLGSTLVYALLGRGPFNNGAPEGVIFRVVGQPPDLTGVPVELAGLLAGCLSKVPAQRPTTDQLLAELSPAIGSLVSPYGGWRPPHQDPAGILGDPPTQPLSPSTPAPPAAPPPPAAPQPAVPATAPVRPAGPVARQLQPGEEVRVQWRQHRARLGQVLAGGLGATVLLGLLAAFSLVYLPRWFAILPLPLVGCVVAWTMWQVAAWRRSWFALTDQRVLAIQGVLFRRPMAKPLAEIVDVRFQQDRLGRFLSYGTLLLATVGRARWELPYVPYSYATTLLRTWGTVG